jgi:hypothetical protein
LCHFFTTVSWEIFPPYTDWSLPCIAFALSTRNQITDRWFIYSCNEQAAV